MVSISVGAGVGAEVVVVVVDGGGAVVGKMWIRFTREERMRRSAAGGVEMWYTEYCFKASGFFLASGGIVRFGNNEEGSWKTSVAKMSW